MLNIPVRQNLSFLLTVTVITIQLAACSTEENINDTFTEAGIGTSTDTGTGNETTTPAQSLIRWIAPAQREDNSPIAMAEIAGYRIYYGTMPGDYQDQIEINDAYDNDAAAEDFGVSPGTYYAVITTVDTDGRESAFSEEVVLNI